MTNNVGSAPWMAPEVFQGTSYTEKCDVYSWGLLLWEIFSRSIPYKDIYKEPYQILWAVCHGTRPSLIPDCPSKIQELYTQCWSKSPNERPSMNEVVKIMTDLFTSFSGIHHEDALCQINGAPVIPADLAEHQRQSCYRLYYPLQYSANSNNAAVKRLHDEKELNKMKKDNMSWKIKYLQGLKLRRELQDQIDNQAAEIFHLKQELEKFREITVRPTSVSSDPCLTTTRSQETNDHHSNVHQNGNFSNGNNKKFSDNAVVKMLQNENEILTKKLNIMNEDFIRLENEHIHDLKLLQEIYEHDIALLLKDNIKFEDSKAELQVRINTQVAKISHLKQTIEKLQELVI
ncbi:hypothetical protein PV325_011321, partial [Microctonus aethiopoides]